MTIMDEFRSLLDACAKKHVSDDEMLEIVLEKSVALLKITTSSGETKFVISTNLKKFRNMSNSSSNTTTGRSNDKRKTSGTIRQKHDIGLTSGSGIASFDIIRGKHCTINPKKCRIVSGILDTEDNKTVLYGLVQAISSLQDKVNQEES